MKLACVVLVGVFALCGCHNDIDLDPTAAASGSDGTVPEVAPVGDGSATVSWEAPTTQTNGTALVDLGGYRIYYGLSQSDLAQSVQLDNLGTQTYVVENLGLGTWYFAVKAVTSTGIESPLSEIVSKTIS